MDYLFYHQHYGRERIHLLLHSDVPMQPYLVRLEQRPGWTLPELQGHHDRYMDLQHTQHYLRSYFCHSTMLLSLESSDA